MAALRRNGVKVGAAKVGPDYIDPGYHRLATGHPSRNLDSFLAPERLIASLAARAGEDSDLLVIEGVMGLFDGAQGAPAMVSDEAAGLPVASTAAVAFLTRSPVVLVVDASAMSQSVAALVHGFASWSPDISLAGVVLNRVASDSHKEGLLRALDPLGIPVLGVLRRDSAFAWRDRHLGLVPVAEQPAEVAAALDKLAVAVSAGLDLASLVRVASSAVRLPTSPLPVATPPAWQLDRPPRIAVAGGPAFSFVYPDNLERLAEAGAELAEFDPVNDEALPADSDGLYAGGGFPEIFAEGLSRNTPLLSQVADAVSSGLPTWAECGGLLWLSSSLDEFPLCGAIKARGSMTTSLTLGYRTAAVRRDNPVAASGTVLRGHEFHYSALTPPGTALRLSGRSGERSEGYARRSLFGTFLHMHLGADVTPAERFVAAAGRRVALR
jgi:cobyrinic acid a,c-diamide synthase